MLTHVAIESTLGPRVAPEAVVYSSKKILEGCFVVAAEDVVSPNL